MYFVLTKNKESVRRISNFTWLKLKCWARNVIQLLSKSGGSGSFCQRACAKYLLFEILTNIQRLVGKSVRTQSRTPTTTSK